MGINEIKRNHRRKHDQTDSVDRCQYCGGFLPADFFKMICPSCDKPVRRYRRTA